MKNPTVKTLKFREVKVIQFGRYADHRGYFTELYKKSDFDQLEKGFLKNIKFTQVNESHSQKGVIRGLHFQWNPYMAKLVRTIQGHMVDLVLDIRLDSPTFGKIIAHDMPSAPNLPEDQWIWVPQGFAHGNFFLKETTIEYFCTGEYNPDCEAGISPLAKDLDWSSCDKKLKKLFDQTVKGKRLISEKDEKGFTLEEWKKDPRSKNFVYPK